MAEPIIPTCPYCGTDAELVTGEQVYGADATARVRSVYLWRCEPCDAQVGCRPGTRHALGTLANAPLRRMRRMAHEAFDPLWRTGAMDRSNAYRWLATKMSLPDNCAHIGRFDAEQCMKVIELCLRYDVDLRAQRATDEWDDYAAGTLGRLEDTGP